MPATAPRFELIDALPRLEARAEAWSRLCDRAIEPNPFYRPELLLPALQAGLAGRPWRILAIPARDEPDALAALIPLELHRRSWRSPFRPLAVLRPLTHPFCFLHTPLFAARHVDAGMRGLTAALRSRRLPATILRIRGPILAGRLATALERAGSGLCGLTRPPFDRAALVPGHGGAPSRSASREFAAKRKKLAALGHVALDSTEAADAGFDHRLSQFLDLESRGWKGAIESAMTTPGFRRDYFERAIAGAGRRHVVIESLLLDDQPIAMQVNLREWREGRCHLFGFKTAFDERYAKLSPGTMLLDEQRQRLEPDAGLALFDSCAAPENPSPNRAWPGRVRRSDVILARRSALPRAYLWALRHGAANDQPEATSESGPALPI